MTPVCTAVLAGTRLRSNRPLPGLPVEGEADLDLDVEFVPETGSRVATPAGACPLPASTGLAGWIDDGGLRVHVVEPGTGAIDAEQAVRLVLPFASALQGAVVLHASAVALPAGVHAFVAASGTGKSTLAAQLMARGLPRVADDLTACRAFKGGVRVPLPADVAPHVLSARLRGLHFLARSPEVSLVTLAPLSPAECMAQLLWNGFSELESPRLWATQFEGCGLIARRVPAYSLTLPDDAGRIAASAAEVLALLVQLDAAGGP